MTFFVRQPHVINWFIPYTSLSSSSSYSGSPTNYPNDVVTTVNYFPSCQTAYVNWVQRIMKKKGVEDGIVEITKELVDKNTMNYQKIFFTVLLVAILLALLLFVNIHVSTFLLPLLLDNNIFL